MAAAAAAVLTGHELYAFPAAGPARPPVPAAAPTPWCAGPRRHRARPRPLQVTGSGSPSGRSWGMERADRVLSLSLHPRTPTLTCSDSATGFLAESGGDIHFPPIFCPSPCLISFLLSCLISRTPHQAASQGHVLPRLRQLLGECISLRRAATSHL